MRVNAQVDRTITQADDHFSQVLDQGKDCSNYQTFIVNVKNPSGVLQTNSTISIASASLAEAGLKDLGVFPDLGRVWLLQVRAPILTCSDTGATANVGTVDFSVLPGDGSAAYSVGYRLTYKSK